MTKEELLEILLTKTGDIEGDHETADQALLDFIDDPEITEAFNAIDKWYA